MADTNTAVGYVATIGNSNILREWRPRVISASGSLDLEDLHGDGRPVQYHQKPDKGRGSMIRDSQV